MKGGIKYEMYFIFQRDIVRNFIIILKLIPCAVLSLDYISSTLEDPGEVIPRPQAGGAQRSRPLRTRLRGSQ